MSFLLRYLAYFLVVSIESVNLKKQTETTSLVGRLFYNDHRMEKNM
jgi:hypothetical protein